jgi:LPS sulfotransferase NodH
VKQGFFSEGKIASLTIIYEDLILEYQKTIAKILEFLERDVAGIRIPPPYFARLADDLSEEWSQRFREERQKGWENRGW